MSILMDQEILYNLYKIVVIQIICKYLYYINKNLSMNHDKYIHVLTLDNI